MALKQDGTVVAWGGNTHGECGVPAGLTDVIAFCGGKEHSLALKADGSVVAWGENVAGQCTVPGKVTGVVKIAASSLMSAALTADHSLLAWGGQTQRQSKVPGKLSDVTDMAAGGRFSLALNQAGAVIKWGVSRDEPVELPAGLGSDVIAITAGADHALALKKDGSVIAWGGNEHGQATDPQIQTITISANTTVIVPGPGSNWGDPGAWNFRVLGGFDGSIACIQQSVGVTECVTTSSDGRFYTLYDPFPTGCFAFYEFVFADYNQC